MKPLSSSNIRGIDYDAESKTLTVHFISGSAYKYKGVPQDVAEDFENAGSPGQFFAANVKDVYACSRVG